MMKSIAYVSSLMCLLHAFALPDEVSKRVQCNSIGGFTFNNSDVPIEFPLSACPKQSAFTCCGAENDATLLRMTALCEMAAGESSASVSTCCSLFRNLRCYACDGIAAVQKSYPVCQSACDATYQACRDVVMSWDATGTPRFCDSDALVCSALQQFIGSGKQLCESLGYPVAADSGKCYSGAATQPPKELVEAIQKQAAADPDFKQRTEARKQRKRPVYADDVDSDGNLGLVKRIWGLLVPYLGGNSENNMMIPLAGIIVCFTILFLRKRKTTNNNTEGDADLD